MKKIAFYVEGQTEQFFIKELLLEIAGRKSISVELEKFVGKSKPKVQLLSLSEVPDEPKYFALIYDCGGDESVKPRILEDYSNLSASGYSRVVGIRDLFPLTDLAKLEHYIKTFRPLPADAEIIVAVNEIEAWFISESNHFTCIEPRLTVSSIIAAKGIDPRVDDMSLLVNPAKDLNSIYMMVGKKYNKKKDNVEATVKCLDYANLYIEVKNRIDKLNDLILIIDNFLT